jgi:hypothetical protein
MTNEKKHNFILKILDKVFAFLTKARCACCNSTCILGDEVAHSTESTPIKRHSESAEKVTMGESM